MTATEVQHPSLPPQDPINQTPQPEAPQPRRKSWRKRVLYLGAFVVLVALSALAAAPMILSTAPARRLALGQVNNRIPGTLSVGGWNLSWFSPLTFSSVSINDLQNREVVNITTVHTTSGIIDLVRHGLDFGGVTLDAPRVSLFFNEQNELSLVEALAARDSTALPADQATQSSALPEPRGNLVIKDGLVRLQRGDDPPVEVTGLQSSITLDTLARITADLSAKFSSGGDIDLKVGLQELVADNEIRPLRARGDVTLRSGAPIDLGPLLAVVAPDLLLSGSLNPDVKATFAQGDIEAQLAVTLNNLQTPGASGASPVNVKIAGVVQANTQALSARLDLTGDAGAVATTLEYRGLDKPVTVTGERVLSAMLTGAPLDLPDVTMTANGTVDVVRLQKALPHLIPVREGQQLTGGSLAIKDFSLTGGNSPRITGAAALQDVAATSSGHSVRLQPIALDVDAAITTGTGLTIARAELRSPFASLNASGTPATLEASFQAALAKAQEELGQIVDFEGLQLKGDLAGTLQLKRAGEERFTTLVNGQLTGLSVVSGEHQLDVKNLTLMEAARIELADGKAKSVDIESFALDVDSQVQLTGRGTWDVTNAGYRADLDLTRADLAFVSSRAAALGVAELARYGGVVTGKASVSGGGAKPMVSSGDLKAVNLTAGGKPVVRGDSVLRWSELTVSPDASDIALATATVTSEAATADVKNMRVHRGEALAVQADIDARADLRSAMAAVAAVGDLEEAPELAGKLALNGKVTTNGQQVSAVGRGGIDAFEVGSDDNVFREERIDIDMDGGADTAAKSIKITKLRLTSTPLTAELAGDIRHYDGTLDAALTGRYDAGWDQLTTLIHELVPSTADLLVIKGRTASTFEIKGPMHAASAQPPFRGLTTGLDVHWDTAEVYGIPLGGASFQPRLSEGQFRLPPSAIASPTGGALNVGATLDFQSPDPTLRVPGTLKLFDNVKVTHQLSRDLLSRFSPIFLNLASVEGRIALHTSNVNLPLGGSVQKEAQGTGFLDLGTMNIKPAGLLAELLPLAGVSTSQSTPVQFTRMDFQVTDGRIRYDNFSMKVTDEFDVRFYGSVGLDESLDLTVSLPVSEGLLRKAGARGPAADMARQLVGDRVEVPLVGTRTAPKLDWSRVDLASLLKNVTPEKLIPTSPEKVEDLIKGFTRPKPKPGVETKPTDQRQKSKP